MALLPALTVKTWRDHWRALLGWSAGLAALSAMELSVYPSVRSTAAGAGQFVNSLPEALKTMFRMSDYTSGPGFIGAELFSFTIPLVFIAVGTSFGSGATALEEERGTADLLLTLPITRSRVLLEKLVALLSDMLVLGLLLWLVLLVGVHAAGMSDVGGGGLAVASLSSVLLGWVYAGVGLLVGAWSGKRSIAVGTAVTLAIAAFVLYSLGPLVHGLRPWLRVTPFQWAFGNDPLRNGLSVGYLALLLATSVVFFGLSVLAFNRRDITA